MKILLVVLLGATLLISGCGALQRAQETFERTEAAMSASREEIKATLNVLNRAISAYEEALAGEDVGTIAAAKAALDEAKSLWEQDQVKFQATFAALDVAKGELKNAESTEDYLGSILGLLGSFFLGGGVAAGGGRVMASRRKKLIAEARNGDS